MSPPSRVRTFFSHSFLRVSSRLIFSRRRRRVHALPRRAPGPSRRCPQRRPPSPRALIVSFTRPHTPGPCSSHDRARARRLPPPRRPAHEARARRQPTDPVHGVQRQGRTMGGSRRAGRVGRGGPGARVYCECGGGGAGGAGKAAGGGEGRLRACFCGTSCWGARCVRFRGLCFRIGFAS
jgi:hypothetical protein